MKKLNFDNGPVTAYLVEYEFSIPALAEIEIGGETEKTYICCEITKNALLGLKEIYHIPRRLDKHKYRIFSSLEDALAFLRNCTSETLHKAVEKNEKVQAAIKEAGLL